MFIFQTNLALSENIVEEEHVEDNQFGRCFELLDSVLMPIPPKEWESLRNLIGFEFVA